jgi:hypothetical protein
MNTPILKEQWCLKPTDLEHYPVWIRVIDFDQDQEWFSDATERTYRPWEGVLPLVPRSPFSFTLVNTTFRLSSGESYPGYINRVREDWDEPLPPRKMRDGTFSGPLRWSSRRGGSPLSILALHSPVIFIGEKGYDFHLRRDLWAREQTIVEFYQAIGQKPADVFPIHFSAAPELFRGIVSGQLDGFYSFPLDRPYEIDTGLHYLGESR